MHGSLRWVLVLCSLAALLALPRGERSAAAQDAGGYSTPAELEQRAEERYAEGRLGEARELYRRIAEWSSEPAERARTLVIAAWLAHLEGHFAEAKADLLAALVADPDVPFRSELYNEAFVDLYRQVREEATDRRRANARDELEKGVAALDAGELETARSSLEAVVKATPTDATAIYNLALVDVREGRSEAAMAGFQKVESLAVARPDEVRLELRARALKNLAILFVEQGSPEDAARSLEQALALDPEDSHAWNHLGLVRRRLGQPDLAAEAFRRALELDPDTTTVAVNLAIAYIDLKRWTDAIATLEPVSRSAPGDASVWLHLGLSLRGADRMDRAASAYRKVLELDPQNAQGLAQKAASELAFVLLQSGDVAGAQVAAQRALAWRPDDLDSLRLLGIAQRRAGHLGAARDTLSRVLELAPDDAETANNLGTIYFALEDFGQAQDLFARALELRPDFSAARENLAKAQARGQASDGGTPPPPRPVSHPVSLGVRFADVDYSSLGLTGALVDAVFAETPAARAGLRKGDLLLRIDGQTIESPQDVHRYLQTVRGKTVTLELLREGRPVRLEAEVR